MVHLDSIIIANPKHLTCILGISFGDFFIKDSHPLGLVLQMF